MPYIAKTDGGNFVLDFRVGHLSDIPVADQPNWRLVIDQPPVCDRLTHTLVRSDLIVLNDEVQIQYSLIALPDAIRKANLKEHAASLRWSKSQSGTTLPNGIFIRTDENTKIKLDQVIAMFDKGWITEVRWKFGPNQYMTLDLAAVTGIAQVVAAFEQACFAVEEQIVVDIMNGVITSKAEIDGYAWP